MHSNQQHLDISSDSLHPGAISTDRWEKRDAECERKNGAACQTQQIVSSFRRRVCGINVLTQAVWWHRTLGNFLSELLVPDHLQHSLHAHFAFIQSDAQEIPIVRSIKMPTYKLVPSQVFLWCVWVPQQPNTPSCCSTMDSALQPGSAAVGQNTKPSQDSLRRWYHLPVIPRLWLHLSGRSENGAALLWPNCGLELYVILPTQYHCIPFP